MKFIPHAVRALIFTPEAIAAQDFDDGLEAYDAGDYMTALRKFRLAAEQGDADAQLVLGGMYAEGQGVAQDYAEAARWYHRAAEQDYVLAQYSFGVMYANGQGVPQDFVTAHMCFNIAAANGDEEARASRDNTADRMTAEAISEAQRRARACLESDYRDCG